MKRFLALLLFLVALGGCAFAQTAAATKKLLVGVTMPTKSSERWIHDGDNLKAALEKAGIPRTHVMVFKVNRLGHSFWKSMGWEERPDLVLFSSPFQEDPCPKNRAKSC